MTEAQYYEYTDAREDGGIFRVTVIDDRDQVIERDIPWTDAYVQYGDNSWIEPGLTAKLQAGYDAARRIYDDSYARYLAEHDRELAAKGYAPRPWPLCLQGNDGD